MRTAFKLKIKLEHKAEYIKRHNPIWKELEKLLFDHGAITYSIYLDENNGELFGYAEVKDLELWNKVPESEICKKWWDYMAPLMHVNVDKSPKIEALKEVFHIEKK